MGGSSVSYDTPIEASQMAMIRDQIRCFNHGFTRLEFLSTFLEKKSTCDHRRVMELSLVVVIRPSIVLSTILEGTLVPQLQECREFRTDAKSGDLGKLSRWWLSTNIVHLLDFMHLFEFDESHGSPTHF
jgi:hypothetical protein